MKDDFKIDMWNSQYQQALSIAWQAGNQQATTGTCVNYGPSLVISGARYTVPFVLGFALLFLMIGFCFGTRITR